MEKSRQNGAAICPDQRFQNSHMTKLFSTKSRGYNLEQWSFLVQKFWIRSEVMRLWRVDIVRA